jgi:transposase
MKLFVGIDLHGSNNVIVIRDETGHTHLRKRLKNELELVLNQLAPFREQVEAITVESTYNWYWLVDGLMDHGYPVKLANPVEIQQYNGIKHTNDMSDAEFLSELLRLGILPTGYICPKETRHLRDLLRKRLLINRQRVTHILSFQGTLQRNLPSFMKAQDIKKLEEGDLDGMFDDPHLSLSARKSIGIIQFLSKQLKEVEAVINRSVSKIDIHSDLLTVTGVGKTLAAAITLETAEISRFHTVGNYVSYCRLVNSSRISNGKKKGENNRKNGNKYLSWAYTEVAQFSRQWCPQAKRFYQRKLAKTNKMVAQRALAHKMARACYYVMKDHVPYDPVRAFGH